MKIKEFKNAENIDLTSFVAPKKQKKLSKRALKKAARKAQRYYAPVYVTPPEVEAVQAREQKEKIDGIKPKIVFSREFALSMLAKLLLTWLSCAGLSLTLAQAYRVPVSAGAVLMVCFGTAVILHITFLYFKRRILVLPLLAFLLIALTLELRPLVPPDDGVLSAFTFFHILPDFSVFRAIAYFYEHILLVLDSRLLSTGLHATYSWRELLNYQFEIAVVYLIISVLISIAATIESRSRLIGFTLVATILLLTPTFAAEIAGFVWGMALLIPGLIGSYCAWAAHAWENTGGIHQINYSELGKKAKMSDLPSVDEALPPGVNKSQGTQQPKSKDSWFNFKPGKLPHFYKYSTNSLIAALLAACAVFYAANAVPAAVKFDYMAVVNAVRDFEFTAVPQDVRAFFRRHFVRFNDGGMFYNPNIGNISMGINNSRTSLSDTPVIRVTLEDDRDKLYLRGGIGIDLIGVDWSASQNTPEFKRLVALLDSGFTPELEYHVHQQMLNLLNRTSYANNVKKQNVQIEYLLRTGFLVLPTNPYDPESIRRNRNYGRHLDTIITPNRRMSIHEYETLYLGIRPSHFNNAVETLRENGSNEIAGFIHIPSDVVMTEQQMLEYIESRIGAQPYFPGGILTTEQLAEVNQWNTRYSELRGEFEFSFVAASRFDGHKWDFPCETPASDWQRDITEYRELIAAVYSGVPEIERGNVELFLQGMGLFPQSEPAIKDYEAVWRIHDYLREHYTWSLTIDNRLGDNTPLGNFLFDTREGHCALYAAAMTLAVRELGIPARYVAGLVTVTGGGLVQDLAEQDFHAWVEVYFENVGWVPFDPTGGARGTESRGNSGMPPPPPPPTTPPPPPTAPPTSPVTPTSPTLPSGVTAPTGTRTGTGTDSDRPGFAITREMLLRAGICLVVIGAGITLIELLRRRRKAVADRFARWKAGDGDEMSNKSVKEMYLFMLKLLKGQKLVPKPGETPLVFAARVGEKLEALMPLFEKVEFGDSATVTLTAEEHRSIYEYVSALYERKKASEKQSNRANPRADSRT
ncbi:MAG: transglutaminase-like domain-containing protein [Oscillospiraceae bacterium]|nr:transglutaminase-like domain-containing protein [Oscillospiraceae bacterium]